MSSDVASEGSAAEGVAGDSGETNPPFTEAKYNEMFALQVGSCLDVFWFLSCLEPFVMHHWPSLTHTISLPKVKRLDRSSPPCACSSVRVL